MQLASSAMQCTYSCYAFGSASYAMHLKSPSRGAKQAMQLTFLAMQYTFLAMQLASSAIQLARLAMQLA
jgi:hypothetical protein